ncbi:hypothetical protein QUF75_00745 [Desulfococcaceae bacterium HSG7]|nr:hypothetical protein [Desulfococcaceae bacterium HSG7]
MARVIPKTPGRHRQSAMRLLEQAVFILRMAPADLLPAYYIGSLPFILGLLYFWGDMSRSADAGEYSASAALVMALLFAWMKYCQALFAARIYARLSHKPPDSLSYKRQGVQAASQTLLHSTGVFILPLALLVTLPFGWCFAFYQNVTVLSQNECTGVRALYRQAWQQARLWPAENHHLMAVIFIFSLTIFVNLAIAVYLFPQMLKTLFGYESIFTLSSTKLLNTTFWITILSLTYLCVDPLIKTVYALRCFYGLAITSGDDIRFELQGVIANQQNIGRQ